MTVYRNLKLTFPQKPEEEITRLQKAFYRHMCDVFLEMVKTMSLDKESVKERFVVTNKDVLQEIEKSKSILLVCAHYANWEWIASINNYIHAKGYAVYQKVSNPYFERLATRMRNRWNTTLITQKETIKTVLRNEQNNVRAVYGMVSDQSPQLQPNQYWSEFMGVPVPIFNGYESLARKLDLAVVFLKVSKIKRGYYAATFVPITLSGGITAPNEITEQFLRLVEEQIRERPELYLWTHRRWKHTEKAPKEITAPGKAEARPGKR
jgi:KDO2-lipid IV(A) lauroyltransferase